MVNKMGNIKKVLKAVLLIIISVIAITLKVMQPQILVEYILIFIMEPQDQQEHIKSLLVQVVATQKM